MLYNKAEEFIKSIFLTETNNKENTLNIPETITAQLKKDNIEKDPEYFNHREAVVHVSSMAKCLRGVVHEMLHTAKDEKDADAEARKLGVFKAGNLFEDYIVESLADKMVDRQTEYIYKYKSVYVTGRDDGIILHEGTRLMLEAKSVNSNSFWHRHRSGELCAYQNQMQIQTYLWFRRILLNKFVRKHYDDDGIREEIIYTNMTKQELWEFRGSQPDDVLTPTEKPDESNLNGIFTYISKDDCTVAQAPVKFNQRIIDETVMPALEEIIAAYDAKNPNLATAPPLTLYSESKNQYQKNWVCMYCDYHEKCAGKGWALEAAGEVGRLNREGTPSLSNPHTEKPVKPVITVAKGVTVEPGQLTPGNIVTAPPDPQREITIVGKTEFDGVRKEIESEEYIPPVKGGEGDPFAGQANEVPIPSAVLPKPIPVEAVVEPVGETSLEKMVRLNKEKAALASKMGGK